MTTKTNYEHRVLLPQVMLTFHVTSLSPGWRLANLVMAAFFFLAGFANTNDNDWYIWTPMYFFPAFLCLIAFLKQTAIGNAIWQTCMSIELGVSIAMALYQSSKIFGMYSRMASNPFIHEEGREMGGLVIILAWTGLSRFLVQNRSTTKGEGGKQNLMTGLLVVALTLAVVPLFTWSLCFVGDWHKRLGHCNGMFG